MTQPTVRWYRARTTGMLGAAPRDLRERNGRGQEELAAALGSSRSTVSRMERGRNTSTEVVLASAAELGYEILVVPRGAKVTIELPDSPR